MTSNSTAPEKKHEGWRQSSTCRDVEDVGKAEGREYGMTEANASTLARLLHSQAKRQFGGADVFGRAKLDGLAEAFAGEQLEELADRLLTATGWANWLEGVVVPAKAPGLPEYTKDLEMDFEKSGPSIDTHMEVKMTGGKKAIVHLRFQKWYQPNLDGHLFEESLKIERKFGSMPMVAVFLMWPPADGPGVTGRYEERDAKNNVKRVFTYTVQRAWEMEPEEVTQTVGTMLLAPLSKDSRRRMPEIVQMIKNGLDRCKANDEMRFNVWDAIYWSMGLICDLEESHRALGDMLPIIQNSRHYLSAKGHGFVAAYTAVQREEGPLTAARALIVRQATRRFGPSPASEVKIEAITSLEELERISLRVLTAPDWEGMMAAS